MPGLMHGYGVSQPVGGSGKLSEALVRCIEHYGGEVRCNAEVRHVVTSGGRAVGLELAAGEVSSELRQEMVDARIIARAYTREVGDDVPDVRDWTWPGFSS